MESIDAGLELVRRFDENWPVKAAFWLKASDKESRFLFIASDAVEDANLKQAYEELLRIARSRATPWLDPYWVKVIPGNDPLARAAARFHERFPAPLATRFRDTKFGDLTIDDAYLYPSPLPKSFSKAEARTSS